MIKFKKGLFIFDSTWAQILASIIAIMLASHVVIFLVMTKSSQKTQLAVNRGLIMRQMITVIEAVAINPPNKRLEIIHAINLPNIVVTASTRPLWPVRQETPDNMVEMIKQLKSLPLSERVLRVSVNFGHHAWLNISGYIETSAVWKLQLFLFVLELIIIVAIGFALWAANHYNNSLTRFIREVEASSRQIGSGQVGENYGPEGVRQAASAINKMQIRIAHIIQTRTEILAAISHDLRTPLTRLKLRCQFIEDEATQTKMLKDLDEMEAMIKESLAYSKDEHHQFEMGPIDLAKTLSQTCLDYQETGKTLRYHGPQHGFNIVGNQLALKRAFNNIIDNGLKYGTQVQVTLRYAQNQYKITIEDDGPGIPSDEYEKVFRPFYRIEKSRSRSTGGTGLGLAAARSIILAHGGEVTLEAGKTSGLRVIVTI